MVPIHNYLPWFVLNFAFYSLEVGAGNRHLVFDSSDLVMLLSVHSCGNSHLVGFWQCDPFLRWFAAQVNVCKFFIGLEKNALDEQIYSLYDIP